MLFFFEGIHKCSTTTDYESIEEARRFQDIQAYHFTYAKA
jgi:hypothetical protein